jgi:hypothetical protein
MPKPEIQEKFDKAIAGQTTFGRAMKATLKANTGTTALTSSLQTTRRQFDDWSPTVETINSYVLQLTMSADCTDKQTIKLDLIN